MKERKKELSFRALLARINRRLTKDGQTLRTSDPNSLKMMLKLGRFYITNDNNQTIEACHVDIEDLTEEMGILKPFETFDFDDIDWLKKMK